ncbi:arginase [soil metagenome]
MDSRKDKTIEFMGVPMDLGQGRRGVDMGPSALRYARATSCLEELGYEVRDRGNVQVPIPEVVERGGGIPHLDVIRATCERTAEAVAEVVAGGGFPVSLGGDHSISIGTVSGAASAGRTGAIWVDAHADFNTPDTSPSGNVHGMPLAALTGRGHPDLTTIGGPEPSLRPEDIVIIGLRSVDDVERHALLDAGVKVFTMSDIDAHGVHEAVRRASSELSHLDRVHLSFDLDVMDPDVAPGVGTPVRGGLTYREAHLLAELLHAEEIITSMDIVEVNPMLDVSNKTAELAIGLLESFMGRRILSITV